MKMTRSSGAGCECSARRAHLQNMLAGPKMRERSFQRRTPWLYPWAGRDHPAAALGIGKQQICCYLSDSWDHAAWIPWLHSVFLTITNTGRQATDLGVLLHTNPPNLPSAELAAGKA